MFELRNKRILLVEPPFYKIFKYLRWYYPSTLTMIGTYLKNAGNDVLVYDGDKPDEQCSSLSRSQVRKNYELYRTAVKQRSHPEWDRTINFIRDHAPDAVGITSSSAQIFSAEIIAERIKGEFGDRIKVYLGGPHVDGITLSYPEYTFKDCFDHVVPKQPQITKEIFEQMHDRTVIHNYRDYVPEHISSVMTSIGCPNRCIYCNNSGNRVLIYRNRDVIAQELSQIRDIFKPTDPITLTDEGFFSSKKHYQQIVALLKEFGLHFLVGARIKDISREMLQFSKDAGLVKLGIGVESGSQKVLDTVEKRLQIEDVIAKAKLLNEMGIKWQAFFITGFPFETMEDIKMTEDLVYRIKPSFVSLNRFTPYPGTKIFNDLYRDKDINFIDTFQLSDRSCVALPDKTEQEIERLFEVFDSYNAAQPK